jgi:hypothetical protein
VPRTAPWKAAAWFTAGGPPNVTRTRIANPTTVYPQAPRTGGNSPPSPGSAFPVREQGHDRDRAPDQTGAGPGAEGHGLPTAGRANPRRWPGTGWSGMPESNPGYPG